MAKITKENIGDGFYTYAFLRADGSPYYVGKGKGNRAWTRSAQCARRHPKDHSQILILKKGLTEEEAFRHEKYMIAIFGRKDAGTGILRNMTDGGDGVSGFTHSEKTRAAIAKAVKGEKNPFFGRRHDAETRARIGQAHRGKSLSTEHRVKLLKAIRGKPLSKEHRAKIAEANRGKQSGEKHPLFGKPRSEETRAKISQSQRGENAPRAKTFVFTSPDGQEFTVTGRFAEFCREQEIALQTMKTALKRNCTPPPSNGWLVRYAETPRDDSLQI